MLSLNVNNRVLNEDSPWFSSRNPRVPTWANGCGPLLREIVADSAVTGLRM
jgi:hypothetical protein